MGYIEQDIASGVKRLDSNGKIPYDNATSGLTATDVDAAIDEVEGRVDTLETNNTGTNTGDEVSATESVEGIVERATQAEVDAGTDTTRYVSPATLSNYSAFPGAFTHTDQSANYTAVAQDLVLMTTGATNKTVDLPAAASNAEKQIIVKKVDAGAGNVVIDGNASETIDGATTQTITAQYTSITLHCDGSNWHIV